MGSVVIALITDNDIILWTDSTPGDAAFSRRNVLNVSGNVVALHDQVDAWLPTVSPLLAQPALLNLPVDQLAQNLSQALSARAGTIQGDLGLIVGGFLADGGPAVFGLHSERNFGIRPFYPSVIGGLPPAIWNYLLSVFASTPQNQDNAIDILLMAGEFYHDIVLSRYRGGPKGSAIGILRRGQSISWLSDEEIEEGRARNARRLHTLQSLIGKSFLELRQ